MQLELEYKQHSLIITTTTLIIHTHSVWYICFRETKWNNDCLYAYSFFRYREIKLVLLLPLLLLLLFSLGVIKITTNNLFTKERAASVAIQLKKTNKQKITNFFLQANWSSFASSIQLFANQLVHILRIFLLDLNYMHILLLSSYHSEHKLGQVSNQRNYINRINRPVASHHIKLA